MELEKALTHFEVATGMTVNYDKTCIYRIGSLANSDAKIITKKPFLWSNGPLKILGIHIDYDLTVMSQLNYSELLNRIKATCNSWHNRGLSLIGKILVINSLCASTFVYRMQVLGILSPDIIQEFNKIVKEFLWDGGRAKISLEKLCNPKDQGGLELINIHNKDLALKCQWVSIIKEHPSIKQIASEFFPDIGNDIWLCNLKIKDIHKMFRSSFWKDVLVAWTKTYGSYPNNPTQIASQMIWYNSHIRIHNSPVYIQKAHQAGILFIYNIWNRIENTFLSYEMLQHIYGQEVMSYLQYYGLISAIPGAWIRELKKVRFIVENYQFPYETFDGKMSTVVYKKLSSNKNLLSKLCSRWSNILGRPIDYDIFLEHFREFYQLTDNSKLRSFQYRFLFRIIYCSKKLYSWRLVESPMCTFCEEEPETLEHLFFECRITKDYWRMFQSWFECQTDTEILLDYETIVFCNHTDSVY